MIIPIILSGGNGTRLWPISDNDKPKQFVKLIGDSTLFTQTLERFSDRNIFLNPIILSNVKHEKLIEIEKNENHIQNSLTILEPEIRNTGPAIASVVKYLGNNHKNSEDVVIFAPSDAYIDDPVRFKEFVLEGELLARQDKIVCFGIKPLNPETGYGYIKTGKKIGANSYSVGKFIEKPDLERAIEFIREKNYLWNAGIFMGKISILSKIFSENSKELWDSIDNIIKKSKNINNSVYLDRELFSKCENISIDYAIIEKLKPEQLVVVSMNVIWSDVGSYKSLFDINPDKNADGNIIFGKSFTRNTKNCFIRAKNKTICCSDIENIVVVEEGDYILVIDKSKSQNLKDLVAIVNDYQLSS